MLKELLDKGYVESRAGELDRRQRQLFPTSTGTALALEIAQLQSRRFRRVFGQLQKTARADAMAFLLALRPTDSGTRMLTDIAIRKAKPGERLVKLSDSGGLQFWITPSGSS